MNIPFDFTQGVERSGHLIQKHWPVVLLGVGGAIALTLVLRNLTGAASNAVQDTPPNNAALAAAGISAGVAQGNTNAAATVALARIQADVAIANLNDSANVMSLSIQSDAQQKAESILATETAYNDTVFATQQLDQYTIGALAQQTHDALGALSGSFGSYVTGTSSEVAALATAAGNTASANDKVAQATTLGGIAAGLSAFTSTLSAVTGGGGKGFSGTGQGQGYGNTSSPASSFGASGGGGSGGFVDAGTWDTATSVASDAALAA